MWPRKRSERPPKLRPPKPVAVTGTKVEQEKQKPLFDIPLSGELPPLDLLDAPSEIGQRGYSATELESLSRLLELKLKDFGIIAEVGCRLSGACSHPL